MSATTGVMVRAEIQRAIAELHQAETLAGGGLPSAVAELMAKARLRLEAVVDWTREGA